MLSKPTTKIFAERKKPLLCRENINLHYGVATISGVQNLAGKKNIAIFGLSRASIRSVCQTLQMR